MRVVGVSRVLDEADIIEPFIRHHARLLDLHIVLDNGSSDGTVEILRALRDEGVAVQVYQTASPLFLEQAYNTGLYRFALQEGADWVFFVDADELLVVDGAARPADVLALVPDGIPALRVPAYRYERPDPVPHPFMNLRRRDRAPEMMKIAVRRADPSRVSVYFGNHFIFLDGREEHGLPQDRLRLAHVSDRSSLQLARKTILARIKPIASGASEAEVFSVHRNADYAALKADARAWLDRAAMPGAVEDQVAYLGGTLRYTRETDEAARMIGVFIGAMEKLAQSHGAILDSKRLIKREVIQRGKEVRRLF